MIEDDVIREVRAAREDYARSHGFSIRAMVADLQARDAVGDWPVVSRPARRPKSPNQAQQPTGAAHSATQTPAST
jgi:hypothetical protein